MDLFPVNACGATVAVSVKDANGNEVASGTADAAYHTVIKLDVKQPHLWNGLADPYCYTAEACICKDGECVDTVAVTFGYRSFHVDPNTGSG